MTVTSPTSTLQPAPGQPSRPLLARIDWLAKARPNQLPPEGEWNVWLILAGRGFGKTRVLVEHGAKYAVEHPGCRVAAVAATNADAKRVLLEGESGLLPVLNRYGMVANYNRVEGTVTLTNGSRFDTYSAEVPDRLRGPQHHLALCDELAAWQYPDTWDMLQFGLRLGHDPKTVIATTPRPTRLVKDLLARPDVHVTRGATFDNAPNLAPTFLAQVKARYDGTRLGRQELYAEVLDDVEGALVRQDWIDAHRRTLAPTPERVVVALDPSDGLAEGDEQGLAVCSLSDGRYYVLHSEGTRMTPDAWLKRAVTLCHDFKADALVYEKNHGGRFLTDLLAKTVPDSLPTKPVDATHGKRTRFEPIAALYEQGKVSHVGVFEQLEEQLTTFTGGPGEKSPDRLDAAVWALTDLAGGARPFFLGAA